SVKKLFTSQKTEFKLHPRGQQITQTNYDFIGMYTYDDLALVKLNGKYGVLDTTGTELIPTQYDTLCFNESIFSLCYQGKCGFVNSKGESFIPFQYDKAKCFFNGYAAVNLNGYWGFVDSTGSEVIKPQYRYDDIKYFSEGVAAVSKDGKWGYINKSGKVVIPLVYDETSGFFSDCITGVRLGEFWGIINMDNEVVESIETDYDVFMEIW
ncbi:MAG: WG repeat-containing protein, partial [Bacteroidia bacterium]